MQMLKFALCPALLDGDNEDSDGMGTPVKTQSDDQNITLAQETLVNKASCLLQAALAVTKSVAMWSAHHPQGGTQYLRTAAICQANSIESSAKAMKALAQELLGISACVART